MQVLFADRLAAHTLRHPDRSPNLRHPDLPLSTVIPTGGGALCRRSGGTPAFRRCLFLFFVVACSCRHSERVFRARRIPMNTAPPQPLTPFSHKIPLFLCRCHRRKGTRCRVRIAVSPDPEGHAFTRAESALPLSLRVLDRVSDRGRENLPSKTPAIPRVKPLRTKKSP